MLRKNLDFFKWGLYGGIMKLKKYLKLNGITDGQAAKELKVTRTWLNLVANEKEKPGAMLVNRIRPWSDGAVTTKDLRPDLFE